MNKKIVVFGALGSGRAQRHQGARTAQRLADRRCVAPTAGFSRRRANFISLDLTDREACLRTFAGAGVRRRQPHRLCRAVREAGTDRRAGAIPNRSHEHDNARQCARGTRRQPSLRHVTLLQGTKAYGAHIAPMRIPGREREPRHPGANFYWNQEDHLIELSARRQWTYSIMRPQVVCGFALGSPMNMLSAIGVFAALAARTRRAVAVSGRRAVHHAGDRRRSAGACDRVGSGRAGVREANVQHRQRRRNGVAGDLPRRCRGVRHAARGTVAAEIGRGNACAGTALATDRAASRPGTAFDGTS